MVLKLGSKGSEVKTLQDFLNIGVDGDFGKNTETAVKKWQKENGLLDDGIVGPKTWTAMGLASTDSNEKIYETEEGLKIERYFLPKGEYIEGPTKKESFFLHHTAGWHNPYNQVDQWAKDTRGPIGTEFIIGGESIKGNDDTCDGKVLQCIPQGGYGWHLGIGNTHVHTHSIGVELCNFGYIVNGKTYSGTVANPNQVISLDKAYRGYQSWHKYSDQQLISLKKLILFVADRDNIDVTKGIIEIIKKGDVRKAFDYNEDAKSGKIKGLWLHANVIANGKFDLAPHPDFIDMLLSI
jgi:hypothetical protein